MKPLVVGIVVGETSGDILGAGLMLALKKQHPHIRFVGIAGPKMKALGCETWFEMDELSVMGIVEVLGRLCRILKIRRELTKRFCQLKPDLFIGIDAPDFNLTLEHRLKKQGIKTIHYVSPSVWAWKQYRIHKIKKATDLVLAFLPFEKAFYDQHNVPCRFIGHKMADDIPLHPDKAQARQTLSLKEKAPVLALLPGSRHSEVTLLSADFLLTAQKLKQQIPDLQIVVPLTNEKRRNEFETIKAQIVPDLTLTLLDGKAREALIASNAALLASGTVALESMLAKCPMIVAYKLKPLTFWIVKRLIKVESVSLPNILAGYKLVPEFLQHDCTPENLYHALLPLLQNDNTALIATFTQLHETIRCNADEQAAKAVLSLINS